MPTKKKIDQAADSMGGMLQKTVEKKRKRLSDLEQMLKAAQSSISPKKPKKK